MPFWEREIQEPKMPGVQHMNVEIGNVGQSAAWNGLLNPSATASCDNPRCVPISNRNDGDVHGFSSSATEPKNALDIREASDISISIISWPEKVVNNAEDDNTFIEAGRPSSETSNSSERHEKFGMDFQCVGEDNCDDVLLVYFFLDEREAPLLTMLMSNFQSASGKDIMYVCLEITEGKESTPENFKEIDKSEESAEVLFGEALHSYILKSLEEIDLTNLP